MSNEPLLRQLRWMKHRMDALYSVAFPEPDKEPDETPPVEWTPASDVFETDDAWIVMVDLPGIDAEQIDVEVLEGRLRIRGLRNRASFPEPSGFQPLQEERPVGRFSLMFSLPEDIGENEVTARFDRGVLTVSISRDLNRGELPNRISVGEG